MAVIQTGELRYSANQRRLKPGGGKERKLELVKPMGMNAKIGTSRMAMMVHPYAGNTHANRRRPKMRARPSDRAEKTAAMMVSSRMPRRWLQLRPRCAGAPPETEDRPNSWS